jgi:hypothetical protein
MFLGHKMEFVVSNLAVSWGRQRHFNSGWTVSDLKVYNMCPAEHGFGYFLISKLLPRFEHIVYKDVFWILHCRILIVWEVLHTFLPIDGRIHSFVSNTNWENTNCSPLSTLQNLLSTFRKFLSHRTQSVHQKHQPTIVWACHKKLWCGMVGSGSG